MLSKSCHGVLSTITHQRTWRKNEQKGIPSTHATSDACVKTTCFGRLHTSVAEIGIFRDNLVHILVPRQNGGVYWRSVETCVLVMTDCYTVSMFLHYLFWLHTTLYVWTTGPYSLFPWIWPYCTRMTCFVAAVITIMTAPIYIPMLNAMATVPVCGDQVGWVCRMRTGTVLTRRL